MRIMQMKGFPTAVEITDVGQLIKDRSTLRLVRQIDQAIPLIGYMAWPNDEVARERWLEAHRSDDVHVLREFDRALKNIQQHWARVADIAHLHYDIDQGHHQQRRGGASAGKAIALIDAQAKSKGTGAAKLWEIWKKYKDVAHLITAAVVVSADAQTRHRIAPYGQKLHQFQPYEMASFIPELVIAVAITIEKYGLDNVAHGCAAPMLDPETVWRIPPEMNVNALPFRARQLTEMNLAVLRDRRAGNRGKANSKTTPVFAETSSA